MNKDLWDAVEELVNESNGGGASDFVKLKNPGDKIVGAFCGEPLPRKVVWTGTHSEDYDPANPAHKDLRPSSRVMMNFFVPSENKMKIIELSSRWFKDVLKVRKKYGLDKNLFEVERHGSGTDTTYSVFPEQSADVPKMIEDAKCELHDLSAFVKPAGASKEGPEFP